MIKKIFTIFLIITAVAVALIARSKTTAEDFVTFASTPNLQITWQNNPLFSVTNMLPGDSISKTVTVKNISSGIQPLGIRAIPTYVNPANFPQQLKLTIKEGGNEIRNYTLADFFAQSAGSGFIDFTDLNPGQTAIYTFAVTFDTDADNTYKMASVVFDLILGLAFDLPAECRNIAANPNTRFVFGTDKKETLTGGNYPNVIVGFGGNDVLNGNNLEDCLIGGDGDDKLHGNNKNDVLLGGNGNDDLNGNNNDDYLDGGSGTNKLDGSNGTDTCFNGTLIRCELPTIPTPTPKKPKK